MIVAALLLLATQQVALSPPASPSAPAQTSFSILWDPCPQPRAGEVLVCGQNGPSRLPLPEERGPPDRPMPSNPDKSGTGALAASVSPCATRIGGCDVGVDIFGAATSVVRLVQKAVSPNSCCEEPGEATNPILLIRDAVHGTKAAFGRKPDHSNRIAIDLDAPPPITQGRVQP